MSVSSDQNPCTNVVVIGGGLMGASAAYGLASTARAAGMRVNVTVIERGERDKSTGSSAGESRITRKTSYEDAEVIPEMTVASNAALHRLGAALPARTVILGNNPRYVDQAVRAALDSHVRHSLLADDAASIPYVNATGLCGVVEAEMDDAGNGAGIVNPRLAIRAMLAEAERNGATLRFLTTVDSLVEKEGGIEVRLGGGEVLNADKVIAAASVWNDSLLGASASASLHTKAKVLKVFWFKWKDAAQPKALPNFIFKVKGGAEFAAAHPAFARASAAYDFTDPSTEEGFYAMRDELSDGTYLKIGHYQPTPKVKEAPDALLARESISDAHEAFIAAFVREFFPGLAAHLHDVDRDKASFTKTYLESFANDAMPVIGPRSAGSNVIVMTGFSGIGAKFAVEAGSYAAAYALGRADLVPEKARRLFAPDRESLRPKAPAAWQINGRLGAPGPDGTVQSPPCLDLGSLGEKAARLYRNGYPPNAGIPEARAAVARMFNRYKNGKGMRGQDIGLEHVYIATGGATDAEQIALEHARAKFASPARPRAVLIAPTYHLYIGQLEQNGFGIDYADSTDLYAPADGSITPRTDDEILTNIRQAVRADTCLLFINSPRNPDGKIYSPGFLAGVLTILDDHPGLRLISDTIYKDGAPGDQNALTLFGLATPEQRRRIYEVDGTSKSVAKTMDRAAWVVSDAGNIGEIAAVSHLKRGRPALPQMLQIVSMDEYLDANAPDYFAKNSGLYVGKLRYVIAAAAQVAGLHCSPHPGAYNGYLDFRAVDFGLPMTPLEKENAVLDALTVKGIAVWPGSTFHHPGALRFNASFCNETLQRLMCAIVDTFEELGAKVTRSDLDLPAVDSPDYDFRPYPVGVLSTQKAGT